MKILNKTKLLILCSSLAILGISNQTKILAQSNTSSVTNSTSPSASSTTTGGTSINYQTNSSFSNDVGFGPGIVCRTPSINLSTSYAGTDTLNWAALGNSGTNGDTASASLGIVVPFGSGVLDYCKTVAHQIALDKEISTQLSMIRACASLQKEGITVDPIKFPLLSDCVIRPGQPQLILSKNISNNTNNRNIKKGSNVIAPKKLRSKTKVPRLIVD